MKKYTFRIGHKVKNASDHTTSYAKEHYESIMKLRSGKSIFKQFREKYAIANYINDPDNGNCITFDVSRSFKYKLLLVGENKNHKDWAKHMKRLIENPNMIEDLGNRLYETVKDKYSLKKVCKDRVEFFKTIINK